jgi:hypothetical protein
VIGGGNQVRRCLDESPVEIERHSQVTHSSPLTPLARIAAASYIGT